MENHQPKAEPFKSESSVIAHQNSYPKEKQLMYPTWLLLVVLFAAFFILKTFIYLPDEKRRGK